MNSQNVEKAKKILVPTLLTIGGLSISYFGYYIGIFFYGFWRFGRFKPTNEMLKKAWEGFEYNPQINTIQTIHQVFKRSTNLLKEIMAEFTKLAKNLRQSTKLEDLDEFISSVKQEIEQKINMSRMCLMHFLQYKNHSFEEFYQKNFVEQNDQQIIQLIVEYDIQIFICYDPNKDRLPTINICVDNLKKIIPLVTEQKPQFDRLRHRIVQNGFDQYRYLFCITYLSDLLEQRLNIQFQTLQTALRLIHYQNIQPNQRVEVKNLWEDYKQLCQSLYE